ncbi:hypothetical protein ILUMI_19026, partial [Ignelater luminosus]
QQFEKITSWFHFNNNTNQKAPEKPGFDTLYKIRPIIEFLQNRFITVEESLAIGEQICATKAKYLLDSKLTLEANMKKMPRGTSLEYTVTVDSVDISNIAWKDHKIVNLVTSFVEQEPQITVRRYDRKLKTNHF